MAIVGIRELARNVSALVEQVEQTGEMVLVTRHGKPVCAIVNVDAQEIEDLLLSSAPEFLASYRQAEEDIAAGLGRPLDEVLAEINADEQQRARSRAASRRAKRRSPRP